MDIVDKMTRSRMMSGIRGRNTKPELVLRRALHRKGFRYRLHVAGLPGRPDIVFPKFRAVIQVHGCFWHRHAECRFATTPASNLSFWKKKFSQTIKRDRLTTNELLEAGWRVAIVWECALDANGANVAAKALSAWLKGKKSLIEFPQMSK